MRPLADPPDPARPLLGLAMIVRDEAPHLQETLEAVASHVEAACIVDTGSTDGTLAIARAWLDERERATHRLIHCLWNDDFSAARNHALEVLTEINDEDRPHFALTLDARDSLEGGAALRDYLAAVLEAERITGGAPPDGAHAVLVRDGGLEYRQTRVARLDAGWRYRGPVHEVLVGPGAGAEPEVPPEVRIVRRPRAADPDRSRRRWARDAEVLRRMVEADPTDARGWFYLGQSLAGIRETGVAITAYRRRIALGGWAEEAYEAQYRVGCLLEGAGNWPAALEALLRAHSMRPARAEPLHAIALHYYRAGDWPACYLFARRAAEIPRPADRLFVQADVYEWAAADLVAIAAWQLGELGPGREAAARALAARPGDKRLQENLRHFVEARGRGQS